MSKKKRYGLVVGIIAACLIGAAIVLYADGKSSNANHDGKLAITATFYPMAEFSRQVGKDKVSVTTLVKPGTEPHDYEPTPKDVAAIYKSKVFVYNGAGLETWVNRIQSDLAHNGVTVTEASNGIQLQAKDPSDTENTSATDPHVWMDPVLAIQEVKNIAAAFEKADPANAEYYKNNADAYVRQLQDLDADFRNGLARCQLHAIVTSHQAFTYVANQYGLHAIGIAGLSPDDEPSPKKLADIADYVKQHGIDYIFFETLVSPKLSETIARETGAHTIAFNPLEGLTQQEIADGKNYISVQKDNLQALRTALHCE